MDNPWINRISEKGAAVRLRLSNKWQELSEQLSHKHRLSVMDTDTLKEKFSMELTGTNIFTIVGISTITLIVLTILLISFTPLHNLIPGYIKPSQREEIAHSAQMIDSLEQVIDQHEQMIFAIQAVINGKPITETQQTQVEAVSQEAIRYQHSKADSLLRTEIEAKHKK